MITVQFMKPFYTKVTGSKLRLVFAYQYFSIIKDDEVFHFIPIEGKEMTVNLNTMQVENLSEVFVFQRGNRFIRLPLYQLMLTSNVDEYLKPILESADITNDVTAPSDYEEPLDPAIAQLLEVIEQMNVQRAIDKALEERNEEAFNHLTNEFAPKS